MKSRDQAVYDAMWKLSATILGYDTYDQLPDDNTDYPFVDFGDTEVNPVPNKTDIKGTIHITLNVWGLYDDRSRVSNMASNLFNEAVKLNEAYGYAVALNIQNSNIRAMRDTSTNTKLRRFIVELDFRMR